MRSLTVRWAAFALVLTCLLAACWPGGPDSVVGGTPRPYDQVPGVAEAEPLPHYRLALELDPARGRLKGRQKVEFPNRTGTSLQEIVFRLYPNLPQYGGKVAIGPVWVNGQRNLSALRASDTSLVVPLSKPLTPGSTATISMTFEVQIPERRGGYVLFGRTDDIWSLPDAYPLLAVHDGHAWHEDVAPAHGDAVVADAALYDVTLTLPPTLTLAATGSIPTYTLTPESWRTYQVTGGPLREFAWVAGPEYAVAQTTAYGTTVRSYYLPGDEAAGEAALNAAAAALRAYSDLFGPYPFAEMAVVEAPITYFGMEYPGMNLLGMDLYREQRRELEIRVAHEVAHQWWYSQVGNDQINTPWLDEGLAEYSSALYFREVYGKAQANALINQRWMVPYQSAKENGLDAVVNQPSGSFGAEYEVIVYAKAALFFDTMCGEVGDEVCQAILSTYLNRYRWRIATPQDLLQVAEEVSGKSLDDLYARWIERR